MAIAQRLGGSYGVWSGCREVGVSRETPMSRPVLGVMYTEGKGVARDDAEALYAVVPACCGARKRLCAETDLASMHADGRGVARDYARGGPVVYDKAAAQGDGRSTGRTRLECIPNGLGGTPVNPSTRPCVGTRWLRNKEIRMAEVRSRLHLPERPRGRQRPVEGGALVPKCRGRRGREGPTPSGLDVLERARCGQRTTPRCKLVPESRRPGKLRRSSIIWEQCMKTAVA